MNGREAADLSIEAARPSGLQEPSAECPLPNIADIGAQVSSAPMEARFRLARLTDVEEMHRVRLAVNENRLSGDGRVALASYLPFVRNGRAWSRRKSTPSPGAAVRRRARIGAPCPHHVLHHPCGAFPRDFRMDTKRPHRGRRSAVSETIGLIGPGYRPVWTIGLPGWKLTPGSGALLIRAISPAFSRRE